jgi:hypothetical protein
MSLHAAAQHIAQKGRGRDKMLVHMSPREVQGLQALAKAKGGHLAVNPETGLPEAGFLENILPIVAAAAATYFTAGAATPYLATAFGPTAGGILAGAGAGALIGGGSAAIQGGDVGQGALIGGAGGALGGAMGAFGGGAETATGTGLNASSTGGAAGLNPNTAVAASNQLTGAATVSPTSGGLIDPLAKTGAATAGSAPASYIPSNAIGAATPVSPTTASALETASRANALANANLATGVGTPPVPTPTVNPSLAKAPVEKGMWDSLSPWQKAGVSTAGAALTAEMARQPSVEPLTEEESRLKRISPNFRAQGPVQPNPYYSAQYPVYAASGGLMGLATGGQPSGPVERMSMGDMKPGMYPQGMIDKTQYATPTQRPASMEIVKSDYDTGVNPITGMQPMGMAGGGGIADLGSYSDGGRLLKGPGDGMSDSIPAKIGTRQPARLADGEFVVPADVVSHLGNGSTNAGAKKLYAMMDRARQSRTGKKKQAPEVNTDKFIPRMA